MKMKMALSLVAVANLILSGTAFAAGAKTYQITGTVVAATGSMVTVQKGSEKFEIDIDPATTKGSVDLKVGAKVTVTYVLSATKLEASSTAAEPSSPIQRPRPDLIRKRATMRAVVAKYYGGPSRTGISAQRATVT